jgi:hypothetical protein
MEKKEIIVEKAVILAGYSIIPVVEVMLKYSDNYKGIFCYYSRRPLAVIVSSKSMRRVIRITGEEVTLEQLIQELPDLKQQQYTF